MKHACTSTRNSVFAAIIMILFLMVPKQSAEAATVVPSERPSGPIISSDGTPFEEPELNPDVPHTTKDPGEYPCGLCSRIMGSRSGEDKWVDPPSRFERMQRVLLEWFVRIRF